MIKITSENYFSNEANAQYMGSTQYKGWLKCEAEQLAIIKGEHVQPDKDVFFQGRYLHAWNEGKLEEFIEANSDKIISSRGKTKGQKKKVFADIDNHIKVLDKDTTIAEFRTGEKEVIFTAEWVGVSWKIMLDIYNPDLGRFVDLKYIGDIYSKHWHQSREEYINFIEEYGYDLQMLIYAYVEQQATGREKPLEPYLLVVEKKGVIPDRKLFNGFLDGTEEKIEEIKQNIERIKDIKEGYIEPRWCGKCEYCKTHSNMEVLPYYMLYI